VGGADVPDYKATSRPKAAWAVHHEPRGRRPFLCARRDGRRSVPEHYEPFETPLGYNPLHPQNAQVTSNPAARVFPDDRAAFGKAADFPHTATTYRLTEHFHYWDEARAAERDSFSRSSSSKSARISRRRSAWWPATA